MPQRLGEAVFVQCEGLGFSDFPEITQPQRDEDRLHNPLLPRGLRASHAAGAAHTPPTLMYLQSSADPSSAPPQLRDPGQALP